MRVLYYSTAYHSNHGGKVQAIEFYEQLRNNESLTVRLFPEKQQRIQPVKNSSWKTKLKKTSFFQLVSFYRRSDQYLKGIINSIEVYKPDVLVMQMDSNFLQIKKIKDKFPDLFICTQINGSHFDEIYKNILFRKNLLKKQAKAYALSDLNVFISNPSRKSIMRHYLNSSRDIIVYNGVDTQKFFPIPEKENLRKKLNLPTDNLNIGYVGTLDKHKKVDGLIYAFRNISLEFPNTHLMIIGDGPDFESLRSLSKKLNVNAKVSFLGWKDHNAINYYLNCFDIAIHHYANNYMSPLKIMEYSAVGLAIIAPNIPAVRDIFADGKDVLITKGVENLESEIKKLLENENLRRNLQDNTEVLYKINQEYTWKAYSEKILKNIEERRSQQTS